MNEFLFAMATSVAEKWETIWLKDKDCREGIEEEIRASIELTLKDAISSAVKFRAEALVKTKIQELVDRQIASLIERGEVAIEDPTEAVRVAIDSALSGVPDHIYESESRRLLVSSFRMSRAGISPSDIAKKLNIGTRAAKRLIERAESEAQKVKEDYTIFFGEES